MTPRIIIHENEPIAPGVPYFEWRNTTDDWLSLEMPDGSLLPVSPRGLVQIPCAELLEFPALAAWLEGVELTGVLRASEQGC